MNESLDTDRIKKYNRPKQQWFHFRSGHSVGQLENRSRSPLRIIPDFKRRILRKTVCTITN